MSLAQFLTGTPATVRTGEVNATNLTVTGRLTVAGTEVIPGSVSAGDLVIEIRRRLQELEAYCQALSEAIYVGPAPGETTPVAFRNNQQR